MKTNYTEPSIEIRKFKTENIAAESAIVNSLTYQQAADELTKTQGVTAESVFAFKL
ncbi:MAG: hypothetical protein SOS24_03925 [Clostridia bacterium]|nr:hypothetical protein [Clostridia bacterium]